MTEQRHQRAGRSIALIGYRGCGKTTVGRELALLAGLPLVDTDELVIRRAGLSIAEIFDRQGEAEFRRLECAAVAQAAAGPASVISVGGGAVLDEGNVAALKSAGTVVWLTAPTAVLITRILGDQSSPETRPALTDRSFEDEIEQLLVERTPFYTKAADHVLDTAGHTPTAVARLVLQQLDLNVD